MSTTSTSTTSAAATGAKTLPMKYKSMHYALLAFIHLSDEFTVGQKVSLIAKLPVFDTIENQIIFYEKMVDFKIVEKEIVKPMIKKGKQDATATATASTEAAVKVKKPRAVKKPKEAVVTAKEGEPDIKLHLPVIGAAAAIEAPVIEAPVIEVSAVEVAVVKKKRVVKKVTPKKTGEAKKVTPKQEEEQSDETNEMLLTDEMKEEPYHTQKLEKPVLKRENNKVVDIEVDHWLIFREGVKYWTTDENEQNGLVYDYAHDQDGDGAPGTIVGKLVNGKLVLN